MVLVKARFDNAESKLRADEFVRARVIWEERSGLKVPTTAISRIAGQNFVFVTEPTETGQGKRTGFFTSNQRENEEQE